MRSAPGRIFAALLIASFAALTVVTCQAPTDSPKRTDAKLDPRIGGRLYSSTSPFNQLIPANPQL
uniref:hypothetical protein n=1 Tax=Paractinoplanes polyasparticus TaxID=2856853 RepID=UPI001C84CEB8